jgi:hypothetical protein
MEWNRRVSSEGVSKQDQAKALGELGREAGGSMRLKRLPSPSPTPRHAVLGGFAGRLRVPEGLDGPNGVEFCTELVPLSIQQRGSLKTRWSGSGYDAHASLCRIDLPELGGKKSKVQARLCHKFVRSELCIKIREPTGQNDFGHPIAKRDIL